MSVKRSRARFHVQLSAAAVGLAWVGACKAGGAAPLPPAQAPAPAVAPSEPPAAKPETSTFRVPPEPTFDLPDDAPVDPAEEARALRHNCCDEAPASEIEDAVQAGEGKGVPRERRKHNRVR